MENNDTVEEKEDTRVNKCSLELLTNPLYQKGIFKSEKKDIKNCKADLKFYRKRLLALTNDYIKGNYDNHGGSNEALRELHSEYVHNVIHYFKMTDKVEIIQNEHAITPITPSSSIPSTITSEIITHNDAQQLSVKHVNTLDTFVKRTKKSSKSLISLPVNRVINYHLPELKNKGVKENKI